MLKRQFKNTLLALPKAKIILDDFTVIAGENDTGKSTVGKVLFSIIKADNMAAAKATNKCGLSPIFSIF